MTKPHRQKISRLYIGIGIVLLLTLAVGYGIFRYTNPNVGFTYYEPSYLPPTVSIKAKQINTGFGPTSVGQNFRTEDWVYSIDEYKAGRKMDPAEQNYDPKSITPTCNIQTSPAKMRYHVCHWIDYGRIDVHEVTFTKGDTFIIAKLPTSLDTSISLQDIDKFVDSFKQTSTVGIPVLRSTTGA
jgi:hypothetical protein